jgi:hypothetical protein
LGGGFHPERLLARPEGSFKLSYIPIKRTTDMPIAQAGTISGRTAIPGVDNSLRCIVLGGAQDKNDAMVTGERKH